MNPTWMLDTNIVSDAFRNPRGRVAGRLVELQSGQCCISIIVLSELRFGALKAKSERIARQIEGFLELVPALRFESPADVAYADTRLALESIGRPIGPTDLFIAAHALALDLTLVTANTSEFSRVPGLRVENWLD